MADAVPVPIEYRTFTYDDVMEYYSREDDSLLRSFDIEIMKTWLKSGLRDLFYWTEMKFCDKQLTKTFEVQACGAEELINADKTNAVLRANPSEFVGYQLFVDQSAIVFANLDIHFSLKNPLDSDNKPLVDAKTPNLLYYANVYGDPGGFADYMLYRRGWQAKGYGLPKTKNGYKVEAFSYPYESFHVYDNSERPSPDLNPNRPIKVDFERLLDFCDFVIHETDGVHLVVATGSIEHTYPYGRRELITKEIMFHNVIAALSMLRDNGMFVMRIYKCLTTFNVGLTYLLSACFGRISLVKPFASRAQNGDLYLVCQWKRPNTEVVKEFLVYALEQMTIMKRNSTQLLDIVPLETLENDKPFYEYIKNLNEIHMKKQGPYLQLAVMISKNKDMVHANQAEATLKCLELYDLPKEKVKKSEHRMCVEYCDELLGPMALGDEPGNFMDIDGTIMKSSLDFKEIFGPPEDWYFQIISVCHHNTSRKFYMSEGGPTVYMYHNQQWHETWEICNIQLPAYTLVYAELTADYNEAQKVAYSLHIIDGIILGGKIIRDMPLLERHAWCQKFAESMRWSPHTWHTLYCGRDGTYTRRTEIYCRELVPMLQLDNFFKTNKNNWRKIDATTSVECDAATKCCSTSDLREPKAPHMPVSPNSHKLSLIVFNTLKSKRPPDEYYYRFNGLIFFNGKPNGNGGTFKTTFTTKQIWDIEWDPYRAINNRHNLFARKIYYCHLERYLRR